MISEIQQDSLCEPGPGYVAFNIWASGERFRKEFCEPVGALNCTASANAQRRSVFIGPVFGDRPIDMYDYFTILHEYGHLLGMGDTYKIPEHQEWEGEQPPSVMNGLAVPHDVLTDDDRMGLWAILNEIRTGTRSCDGFGKTIDVKYNTWKLLMCDPKALSAVEPALRGR